MLICLWDIIDFDQSIVKKKINIFGISSIYTQHIVFGLWLKKTTYPSRLLG